MSRTLTLIVATAGILVSAPVGASTSVAVGPTAAGQSQTAADRKFDALLNAIDVVPKTRADLERLFKDAHQRLLRAAKDEARKLYPRLRAMTFLSFFPEDATRSVLKELTGAGDKDVRRYAYYTVGRTFGTPGDPALVSLIAAGAADDEVDVRTHAVRSLRWIDHADAGKLLERLGSGTDALSRLARTTTRKRNARLKR